MDIDNKIRYKIKDDPKDHSMIIFDTKAESEYNVILRLQNWDKDKSTTDIFMNLGQLNYTIGEAVLQCLSVGIESKFEFDNLFTINDYKEQMKLLNYNKLRIRKKKENKSNIILSTKIYVNNEFKNDKIDGVEILIRLSNGFVNKLDEDYNKYKIDSKYQPKFLKLSVYEASKLVNFITELSNHKPKNMK